MTTKTNEAAAKLIHARQEAILADADTNNGGNLTAAQREEFDSLQKTYRNLTEPQPEPRKTPAGMSSPAEPKGSPCGWTPGRGRESGAAAGGRAAAELFGGAKLDGGFRSVADLCASIHLGDSQRLMTVSGGSVGVPADGGWGVPSSLEYGLLDGSLENEVLRPRCRVIGMPTAEHNIWDFDDHTHASGVIAGGLAGNWVAEADEPDYDVPKLKQLKLVAHKNFTLCAATNELLSDAPGYQGQLEQRMRDAIGWILDRACLITGTGAGQPLSALNAASTITQAKETGQGAATIQFENLAKMFSRMHPSCVDNSIWVAHPSAIPQLLTLAVSVGTGGSVIPVMTESSGVFKMLTRPVVFTEKCNALGTAGDILLMDPTKYIVGLLKGGMRLDTSTHLLFKSDQVAFRLILRVAGLPLWATAFTPVNGSTLSWCVSLATRA